MTTTETIDMQLAEEQLKLVFGMDSWRPGQIGVIQSILEGRPAAAIFPTGGGKSLCYQLPSQLLSGLTVVVSPLMALMKDQVQSLQSRGVAAVRLDSSQSADEARQAMSEVRSDRAKMLYVAPERFFNERFRKTLEGFPISLFAIDEAHCISQWGHSFRPDYLKLAKIAKQLKVERILALTATATPMVIEDIRREFEIAAADVHQTTFYRPNLHLRFELTDERSRLTKLVRKMRERPAGATIVYVSLQKTAEEVAAALLAEGFDAKAYHAGMEDEVRRNVQDWFMESDQGIVVATIAFGMGVDKSNIRYVYHWNPAKSLESYAQEIGRAGRDGANSICETLLVPEDRIVLENFVYGDIPTRRGIDELVELIAHQHESFHVSYYALSRQCDIRDLVVRTLLTYMELDGYLESTGPRYDEYKFKPRVTSSEILKHFDADRRQFVSSVLQLAVKQKVWCLIDVTKVVHRLRCERDRVIRMLEYLSEKGWIELETSGLMFGYRRLKGMENWQEIAEGLHERLLAREQDEIGRIELLFELASSDRCQSASLSEYFGQPMDQVCGHCSFCRQESISEIPEPEVRSIGSSARSAMVQLSKKHPESLREPRQQARFLVGISSPGLVRDRLTRDPNFGCCAGIPFATLLDELT